MLPAPDASGYRMGDRSVWFDGYDLCRFIATLSAAHGVALIDARGSRRYTTLFLINTAQIGPVPQPIRTSEAGHAVADGDRGGTGWTGNLYGRAGPRESAVSLGPHRPAQRA